MEIALHILLLVICILLGLFLINRYVFCWVGLVLSRIPTSESPILQYKTVGVREPNSGSKRLCFVVNLPKLNTEFASNPDYEVIYHRGHATVYDGMITIYRKFGKVWYYLSFSTYTRYEESEKRSKLVSDMTAGTGTPLHLWRKGELSVKGESPFIPSYLILRRVNSIVRDLPVYRTQKSEISRYIRIGYETGLSLSFI
ncbi:MAG: hypothetical protein ACRD6X_05510 [Pyrinomonadaceae bacterium]